MVIVEILTDDNLQMEKPLKSLSESDILYCIHISDLKTGLKCEIEGKERDIVMDTTFCIQILYDVREFILPGM